MSPAKRRRTGGSAVSAGKPTATQSRLSFRSTKAGKVDDIPKNLTKDVDVTETITHEHDPESNTRKDSSDQGLNETKDSIVRQDQVEDDTQEYIEPIVEEEDTQAAADDRIALAMKDNQIGSYWALKEGERIAPRVHQEGLDVGDKVLREFDMTARFGPSIGITRIARWRRAKGIGLDPPHEVLAIILKRDQKGISAVQRSIVDDLMMTSRTEVAAD